MNQKSLEIKIPNIYRNLDEIKILYSNSISKIDINILEYEILMKYKNNISLPNNCKFWDFAKKLTNPYELVHIPTNKRKKNESISFYNPLSRSYYKLWEILDDFKILEKLSKFPIKSTHIAEGPGGFIEAFLNKRKPIVDDINAITLKSNKKEIPGWKKGKFFIDKNPNIHISYGSDNTGNIYNIKNIIYFTNLVGKNSCDFVTADGGFDFSVDFNKQEQLSSRLIFCEIVLALSVQKIGGFFVCKIFDSCTNIIIKLLWMLSCVYEKIIITKPFTSRQANSEKYIVAYNFLGIPKNYLSELYNVVNKWEEIESKNLNVIDIFNGNSINKNFSKIISNYNTINYKMQVDIINKTFQLIKIISEEKDTKLIEEQYIKEQIINALEWCQRYKVDINFKSKYLTKKDEYIKYFDINKYNKWLFHFKEFQKEKEFN